MLGDTLKLINDAEEKADNIIAKANQTIQDIEKETYQKIEMINTKTDQAIAAAIANLPQPTAEPVAPITYEVPANQMQAAVDFIVKSCYEV